MPGPTIYLFHVPTHRLNVVKNARQHLVGPFARLKEGHGVVLQVRGGARPHHKLGSLGSIDHQPNALRRSRICAGSVRTLCP